jgi:hypothetical protein
MRKGNLHSCEGIRIRGVGVDKFKADSAKKGETMTKILRKKLEKIADSYPDEIINEPCQPCRELMITNFSENRTKKLQAIAAYMNVDVSSLLKVELTRDLINNKKATPKSSF